MPIYKKGTYSNLLGSDFRCDLLRVSAMPITVTRILSVNSCVYVDVELLFAKATICPQSNVNPGVLISLSVGLLFPQFLNILANGS